MSNTVVNYLFLYCLASIWVLLLVNIILSLGGYKYYSYINNRKFPLLKDSECPTVSILVPAHNEGRVIYKTAKSLLSFNYPKDKMELIVINDNSSDNTGDELERAKRDFPECTFKIITTDSVTGGKGKSNALNLGYKESTGDYIAIYDADNTAESLALRHLITRVHKDRTLGAVIGKFRTRNKKRNLLTKFINIETLSFQWIAQAGRWQLFNLCTIPGTNFVIRRSIIEKLGGWDTKAIAEDTEISFRIYQLGYKIAFHPLAVTWEQEPQVLKVWFKQRTRWAKGNIYVLAKYIKTIFKGNPKTVMFDISYFFTVYFLFLASVIISDSLFILGIFTDLKVTVSANFILLWVLAYVLYILEVSITLTIEKGEGTIENIFLVAIMYFTYSQLWLIVTINAMIQYVKDKLFKREVKWYKTERFD